MRAEGKVWKMYLLSHFISFVFYYHLLLIFPFIFLLFFALFFSFIHSSLIGFKVYPSLPFIKILFDGTGAACSQAHTRKPNLFDFPFWRRQHIHLAFHVSISLIIFNWICQAIRSHLILHPAGGDCLSTRARRINESRVKSLAASNCIVLVLRQ